MNNGRKPSQWLWAKLSEFEGKIDWVQVFFWFGLITIEIIIVTFLASLIIKLFGVWEWLYLSESQLTSHRYLLSATAQLLAAIFALVFSITLIGTQFVTKYTHRTMRIIFSRRIFFYIVGFALAVIFPLWWIVTPMGIGSFLSVVIASLFVLSIPGFFVYLIRKMGIEGVIAHIKKVAIEAVRAEDETNATAMINALDNIGMGAYTDRNFEVFDLAYRQLTKVALGIEKKSGELKEESEEKNLHDLIFEKLGSTCLEVIESKRVSTTVITLMGKIGADAIRDDKSGTWEAARDKITIVETWCKKRELMQVSASCANALHLIALNAPKEVIAPPTKSSESIELRTPYQMLLESQLRIHRKHLAKEWEHFIPTFIDHTFELIELQIANPWLDGREVRYPHHRLLLDHLFEFAGFALKSDYDLWAITLFERLCKLYPKIDTCMSRNFTSALVENLDEYGKECLKAKGDRAINFYALGGWLYKQVASIAELALKQENYQLCRKSQKIYSVKISEGELSPDHFDSLVASLIKQTRKLLKVKPKVVNEDWAIDITRALCNALTKTMPRKDTKVTVDLWGKIEPLGKKLLRCSLQQKNRWDQAVSNLHGLSKSLMWTNEEYDHQIPREELFKNVWLTMAAHKSFGGSVSADAHAHNLINHKLVHEFFNEYQSVQSQAIRLKILDSLQEVYRLLAEELKKRYQVDVPPLTS